MTTRRSLLLSLSAGIATLGLSTVPGIASAKGYNPYAPVTVYVTRHAEKQTEQMDLGDGKYMDICGVDKCAEELSSLGKLRAERLAAWFAERGVTGKLTHAFSSHKQRTRQTIEPTVALASGLAADSDLMSGDGIQQLPADGTELAPESTKPSIQLTADALRALPGGSTALVAGHSGSIYKIFENLGVDTSNPERFPRDPKDKVRDFGDVWKLVIQSNGVARVDWKVNLQLERFRGTWR